MQMSTMGRYHDQELQTGSNARGTDNCVSEILEVVTLANDFHFNPSDDQTWPEEIWLERLTPSADRLHR